MTKDLRVTKAALNAKGPNKPQAVLEAVMARVNQAELLAESSKDRAALLRRLTSGQVAVLAISRFEVEMNSGGFMAYFEGPGGDFAAEALAGLKQVGSEKFARVLAKGLGAFPNGVSDPDGDKRASQLDEISNRKPDAFKAAQGEFFDSYDGEESLSKLLIDFIRKHPEEFFTS